MIQQTYADIVTPDLLVDASKECLDCRILKPFDDFHKSTRRKEGVCNYCKPCMNKRSKAYKDNNKDAMRAYQKEYVANNKEKITEQGKVNYKENYAKNADAIRTRVNEYRLRNPEKVKNRKKVAYQKDIEVNRMHNREYYKQNPDKRKEYAKKYRKENPEKIKQWKVENKIDQNAKANNRQKAKKEVDPLYKLKCNTRSRLSNVFTKIKAGKKPNTLSLLGTDWQNLKLHIEIRFTEGMTWNNYGEWEVDHIMPLAIAKTKESLAPLCHYTNLQPLWAKDNREKHCKIPKEFLTND